MADLDLQVRLWRVDVAIDAAIKLEDLANAELLVFALDDDESLNGNVRERLQEAVYQMRGQGAAMAILAKDAALSPPSRFDFLHQAAQEVGVRSLFPQVGNVPAGTESDFTTASITPLPL
jgi:hypothetical protein